MTKIFDDDELRSAAAAIMGRKGGQVKSEAKTAAVTKNAILAGQANRLRSTPGQKRARLANLAKARAARAPTLEQIQGRAIEKLLAIREPGPRSSGHVQTRMRAAARQVYAKGARRLGYDAEQIAEQWNHIQQIALSRRQLMSAELGKAAEP